MPEDRTLSEAFKRFGRQILTEIDQEQARKRSDDHVRIPRATWDEHKREIDALKARVERQTNRTGDLQRDKASLNECIERQGHELDFLRTRVGELEREAANRDGLLGKAQRDLQIAKAELANLKLPTADHVMRDDQGTIESLLAHVADLEAQQQADVSTINDLKERIVGYETALVRIREAVEAA